MRLVVAVVGHAAAVGGAPIDVAAAVDCTTGPAAAVESLEAGTAALALALALARDAAGSSGSSVGAVGGQQLASLPALS
jgi:hypothetical protein